MIDKRATKAWLGRLRSFRWQGTRKRVPIRSRRSARLHRPTKCGSTLESPPCRLPRKPDFLQETAVRFRGWLRAPGHSRRGCCWLVCSIRSSCNALHAPSSFRHRIDRCCEDERCNPPTSSDRQPHSSWKRPHASAVCIPSPVSPLCFVDTTRYRLPQPSPKADTRHTCDVTQIPMMTSQVCGANRVFNAPRTSCWSDPYLSLQSTLISIPALNAQSLSSTGSRQTAVAATPVEFERLIYR